MVVEILADCDNLSNIGCMLDIKVLILPIIFVATLILIGIYFRDKKTSEEFFMASRQAGAFKVGASTFNILGAGEVVTLVAFVYLFGVASFYWFLGMALGAFGLAFFVSRLRAGAENYDPYTVTDYMRNFLGPKSEKLGIILQMIAIGSLVVIPLIVGGLLVATLTGFSYELSVVIIALITATYLSFGGLNSVFVTDVIQMIAVLLLLVGAVLFYNPSGMNLGELVALSGNITPSVDLVVLLISGFLAIFAGGDVIQRVFAARSNAAAKGGMNIAGVLFLVLGLLVLILGLNIFSQFPMADPNNAFFEFLGSELSPLFVSFLSVFLLGAILSTTDTEIFIFSILLAKLFGNKKSERNTGKSLIWFITVIMALIAVSFTDLVAIFFVLLYTFNIVGPVVLARLLNRGNDMVAFLGMLISFILLLILGYLDLLVGFYPLLLVVPPMATFLFPSEGKTQIVD